MHGWIDPFYVDSDAQIEPGQIWSDQPIYLPPRHALKIKRVDPKDDRRLDLTICGRTDDTFDHDPIHSLHLSSTEGAVVAKTKKDRPVIVLGGLSATELKPSKTAHADTVMVVPVYGADQYDVQFRKRVAYYEFTNAFYLPEHKQFDEGFARLDHVQPVMRAQLRRHRGLRLADDALEALIEWFVAFTTGRQIADSLILDYRREMLGEER